jgi:hypothetical protein
VSEPAGRANDYGGNRYEVRAAARVLGSLDLLQRRADGMALAAIEIARRAGGDA